MATLHPPPVDSPRWLTNERLISGLSFLVFLLLSAGVGNVTYQVAKAQQAADNAEQKADSNEDAIRGLQSDVESIKRSVETQGSGVRMIENWVIQQKAVADEKERQERRRRRREGSPP